MSYPIDLDEFTEEKLRAELELRAKRREQGLCDYCGRPPTMNSCKFPERHNVAPAPVVLTFRTLRRLNVERCRPPYFRHTLEEWTPSDWVTALTGEVGEAANLIKKVRRGDVALVDARESIADELADVATYLDLLAAALGIDLEVAVVRKFNAVSDRVKCPFKLSVGDQ